MNILEKTGLIMFIIDVRAVINNRNINKINVPYSLYFINSSIFLGFPDGSNFSDG